MRKPFAVLILFLAVLGTGCHGDKKASLGLLEIFNKFINVTDLVGQVPPILQNIAGDIVDDIRHLIPEIEKLLADNNITEVVLTELGKSLNVTRVTHELIPQLDEVLESNNVTETIEDIVSYLKFSNINDKLLPELDNFVKSNNISQIFAEIRKLLNVTVICNLLLPEIERFLEGENITAIVGEVRKFLDMADISGKLVPTIGRIFDSNNVSQIVAQIDYLLNLTHLAEQILPGLGKLFEEIKINETIAEIRKFLNITHVGGQLLDEVEKMLDESNITYHVPELKPFLNISIVRRKLAEVERILDYLNISEILDEIEKHLDVDYLISKVPDLDEFLESVGLTKLLTDIKELLEMSSIKNHVDEIKKFMLSANITDKINDLEKLLNVTYLERVVCAELKRMVRENNLTDLVGEAEKFLNTTYLSENIVPEIRKIWDDLDGDGKLEMLIKLTNTSYWIELLSAADRQYNITLKGQQISEGDLPGVVNEILENIFVKVDTDDPSVVHPTTLPPSSTTLAPGSTEKTTVPPVCITDCHGVPCGTAIINSCKECVMGTTGRALNHGMDCNNVCNGKARNDTCGACSNPPENDQTGRDSPYADCHDTCFGSADIDNCSDCTGGKTGKQANYRKDKCGVCGGNDGACAGCDGVPNSGLVNDSCNVCGGDGSTCTSITKVVPPMLPTTSSSLRTVVVHGAGLDGQSIKCIFNGGESAGTLVDRTHCKCTIPSDQTAGSKSFTVKVVKGGKDVPTADLTITLYDAVNTKITSLGPAEIFTSETTVLTFGGSGLPSSTDAVCMVNGTKISAMFSGGSYTCTLPSYANSKQITVALSLNGVHELASDVALTRTVYARAPTLSSAQFSDTGALINVEFSKDCATSSLTSCSDIFDSASRLRLGASPGCSWSDARHLIITPAANANISPNDPLTLKANAVKSGGEQFSKYATGSATVQAPVNPDKPIPVIVGPTQISSCGDLSLNGGQSSGGGGRDLKYTWSLVSASNAAVTALLDAAQDNPKVFINGSLMTAGSSYTFRLAVKNFLSSSSEHSDITVTKATNPLPEVTINGPFEGKALAANTFHITAMAKAATCSSDKALAYAWTVTCTNDDANNAAKIRAETSAGFKETSSKSALKVDGGSLIGGKTYVFKVVVALKATPSTATTMETTVTAEWSALQAAISGGDRTVGRDSGSLVLDGGSSTVDPDNAGGDLVCSWICEDMSNNQPCYSAVTKQNKIPFPNQCRITISSAEFEAERSYKIKSQVSKGSRTASSSITLTVIAGKPPVVSVVTSHLKISSGEKVKLRGTYTSSIKPTKVEWSCAQENDYRYVDLADASLISSTFETYKADGESFSVKIIKANILTPGASYKFILNVNDGSKVGSSNMIVEVRSGPTSGSFEANPTTLKQLETVTLTAPRWVTDSDANPLQYEFGFVNDKGIFQPWATQTNNEYSIAVPPGYGSSNHLTLKLKVSDAFGSVKWAEKKITVTPLTSINEQAVETMMDASLQEAKDTGDFSKAVPNIRNILQTVSNNSGVSADFAKKVTSSTVDTLLLAVDATSLDKKTAEPILKTFLQVNPEYIEKGNDVLGGVKDVVKASGENLGKATIDETLSFVAGLSSKVNLSDAKILEDLRSLDDSLASSLASGIDLGEPPIETSADNPRAVIKVAHSVLEGSIQAKTGSDATGVEFGSELSKQYGNWKCGTSERCLGVRMKMISYKKDYYSDISSSKPDIIPDKIISLSLQNPETGDDLSVSGLSEPVKLTFQVGTPSDGKKFVSYYFDEIKKVWSSEGMTWVLESDKLVVSVIHLTSFSPAEEPTKLDSDDDNTGLIIGLVVGLTFGVLFVVLLVAWCVYRSKKNAKVRSSRSPSPIKDYDNDGMEHEMAPV